MSGLPDIQQNNEQILNDIQSLQQMEQQLFTSLETNTNLTSTQQEQIIDKINQISTMRVNLYQTLSGVNNYFQNALTSSIGTLKEQTVAIAIVESELNQAKKRLALLEEEKNNKVRLVEINDYYGEKYAEHGHLMKIIIFTLIPIILLAILNNRGLLPDTIYYGLVIIIALFGSIFFWYRMFSIWTRDNMNYQEYDWPAPSGTSDSATISDDPWFTSNIPGTCIGSYCCSTGQTYDTSLNQCIGDSTVEPFVTESMLNNVLSKNSGVRKTDYTVNADSRVLPSNSDSFINYQGNQFAQI
jgi:hypothetical protein